MYLSDRWLFISLVLLFQVSGFSQCLHKSHSRWHCTTWKIHSYHETLFNLRVCSKRHLNCIIVLSWNEIYSCIIIPISIKCRFYFMYHVQILVPLSPTVDLSESIFNEARPEEVSLLRSGFVFHKPMHTHEHTQIKKRYTTYCVTTGSSRAHSSRSGVLMRLYPHKTL